MTPVERLQAAIQKLERLQSSTSLGEWWRTPASILDGQTRVFAANGLIDDQQVCAEVAPADADLIVTLHRTIDAQLTVLRIALAWAVAMAGKEPHTSGYVENGLVLADAINGVPAPAEGVAS